VAVVVGLITGAASEPIKAVISARISRREMTRLLYRELGGNFAVLCLAVDDPSGIEMSSLHELLRFEYFEHAIAKQDVYATVDNGAAIRATNGSFMELRGSRGSSHALRSQMAATLLAHILYMVRASQLDGDLLTRHVQWRAIGAVRYNELNSIASGATLHRTP
jgi:hypothetical protein